MAKGNDEPPIVQNFKMKKTKMDFSSWYEQIQEGCPALIENKEFWTRKGNSQKVTCSLCNINVCNIGVDLLKNTKVLKSALLNHVEDKYHKKRFNAFTSIDPTTSDSLDFDPISQDFATIYDCFIIDDPVVKTSKQFITNNNDNKNYFCTLCKETVLYSTEMHKFRYNLWIHINTDCHRKKLPNYKEVEKNFQDTMLYLSKTHAPHLKLDLKYFKIGPIFKYVSCSLCQLAIHAKAERLVNHLMGDEHQRNLIAKRQKQKEIKEGTWKKPKNIPTLAEKTQSDFQKLMAKIATKFKGKLKFFEPGKMPGYIVCKMCSKVLLPTKNCIETHIDKFHKHQP